MKNQTLALLNRMPVKATNIATELHGELRNATDWHIANVILSDERTVTINESIYEELRDYFQKRFT